MTHPSFAFCSHDALLRELLPPALGADPQLRCTAVFASPADLIRIPGGTDLLLLDADGPEDIPTEVVQEGLQRRQWRRVVLLTGVPGAFLVHSVLSHGWHGVAHKHDGLTELRTGLDRVLRGGIWFSAEVDTEGRRFFSRYLSDREVELTREMARTESLARVASMFGLTPATVRTHRRNIFHKLGLRSQAQLLRFALRTGLLTAQAYAQGEL